MGEYVLDSSEFRALVMGAYRAMGIPEGETIVFRAPYRGREFEITSRGRPVQGQDITDTFDVDVVNGDFTEEELARYRRSVGVVFELADAKLRRVG